MTVKLLFFVAIFYFSNQVVLSKSVDGKRIYHDISSGQGLYQSDDKVNILKSSNFVENVVGSSTAWIVEFYNSWCGHCIQFAPVWKDFAKSISSWNKIIKVGAVDCSNEMNSDLCRDYEIMKYPTLRYFAPHTTKGNYGIESDKSYNVGSMRKKLIKKLLNTTAAENWPSFSLWTSDVYHVWSKVSSSVQYAVFFVEPKPNDNDDNSLDKGGVECILDLSAIPEVFTTRVTEGSTPALQLKLPVVPGIAIMTRSNDIIPMTTPQSDNIRDNSQSQHDLRLQAVMKYLELQGVHVPASSEDINGENNAKASAADVIRVIEEEMNRPDQEDIVYQIDLETALRYSLERDVPLKAADIEGERLVALRAYVNVLTKYFPFDPKGRNFLHSLNTSIAEQSFTPVEFQNLVLDLVNKHDPFLMKKKKDAYIGCSSRFSGLRGYPCTLWTLFHTLTVAAESKPHLSIGHKEVMRAMQGYIKHFFSCTDCANNFAKEVGNLEESIKSLNDSILYLWKTHNHVNFRLHQYPGNLTEDPDHPKIQFPSITHCPQCYTSSGDWNETAVLSYLKNIYTKISYKAVTETVSSSTQIHTQTKREVGNQTPLVIDTRYFNMFDISLCVVLYFASAGILILVGLKFCLKKSHRKKNYIYDVLGKA
ncbi:sulfhydryl oxidase 1-like [Diaphorina citri]|uniref:Sulfhydryl oxidase n=1 Tax=Diaphorina citri TaxID=121845 RepID=A0A3Q0JDK6_DIACI|nr:sulfhydryl oxidase 1-like [Diaphorina citri]XP_026686520.1 sulfhydryl oxidase 1-like [Diaphorina citri]XP_026686521.1 sulfhydryl oxidase 1-like [Diaphorina citri]XP_026686522.1 sulfhydryl oxidase 1-like [Diaphorina citri]